MTIRREAWPAGRPAWADLMVPDRYAARDFYTALFGWEFEEGSPETGYYTMALKNGEPVIGMGEPMEGQEGTPSRWTTYLASEDVEADVAKAVATGASVLALPMQVMEFGSMAVIADPTGAVASLWQAGTHTGYTVADEPGAVVWTEQLSNDLEGAKEFFAGLFGYTYTDMSSPEMQYVVFKINGEAAGGLGQVRTETMDAPAHWLTYFGVEDTDASAATLTENGGTVLRPARDTPVGRIAVVAGPVGEVFAIIAQPAAPAEG